MTAKVSSFPFRSVVSISWSEIVQSIRVCSRFIKAFVQTQPEILFRKFLLKVLIKVLKDFKNTKRETNKK